MPEKDSAVGVNVGVRILSLSVLCQNSWHDRVDGVDDLEEFVVRHVLEGKLSLACVSGVRLAQNSMSVAGDDLGGETSGSARLAHVSFRM